jgi:hypothetical protein
MPYIKTLENRTIAVTPREIFGEMASLLELDMTKYVISFKQAGGDTVGVDLPVWFDEGRARKKRWWEAEPNPNQLNLPFRLYQPATILRRQFVTHRREMQIKVQYTCDGATHKRVLRYNDGSCNTRRNNVIALQLHRIRRTFVPDAAEHGERMGLTVLTGREATTLLNDALARGLDIQTDGIATDRLSGDVVGADFQRLYSGARLNSSGEPLEACRMRLRDGEGMTFYIERRRLRQFREERPTEEECSRLLTQAVHRGMVITSTGDLYDKVSGELIGTDARLDASPPVEVERGELALAPPSSASGDVRLLSGQTHSFWIESHLLGCRASESYFAPTQPVFNVRGTQSGRITAGGYDD